MEKLVISKDSLQQILNYLAGRPYVEVFQLVQAIQQNATPLEQETATKQEEAAPASN